MSHPPRIPQHLQQGSAFKELVMIPTFAPELARPYHVPGTPEYYAAQAQRLQEAGLSPDGSPLVPSAPAQSTRSPAAASSTSSSPGPNDVQADPQLAGSPEIPLFSARVTMHWTVSVRDGRKVKTAKKKETKLSDPAALLDATRSDLLTTILVAHDIPVGSVVVNAPSGPSFLFWYKGVAKGSASKIVTDAEWLRQREQLKSAWIASKGKLKEVSVELDLESLEKYRTTGPAASLFTVPGSSSAPSAQGPTSIPSGTAADAFEAAQLEIVQGTNVPSASSFPSETQGIAAAVEEIKASSGEWCCKEHGPTCYVDALGHHHGMNRYRYVGWGTFLVANPNAHPRDGPPESLVSSWRGTPHVNPSSTARKAVRGRTGNGRSAPVDLFESPSMIQLGAAIASAVSAGMAQAATTSDLKKSRTRSHTPPSSPARPSSPPPAIEDELDAFLTAFKAARGVADDQISALSNVLHARKYTPEGLCDVHLTVDHFRQLTGLEEGEVLTLLSFARRWTGRIEQKRIKRARYSL